MRLRHQDGDYLRDKAAQFRAAAAGHQTPICAKLRELADELERRAAEIDKCPEPPNAA